ELEELLARLRSLAGVSTRKGPRAAPACAHDPATDQWVDLGGTPADDAQAKADSWPRIRSFLSR
ncbi:hypothetical protein ACWDRX_24555, partial [Streptomyces nigra]